MATRRAAEEDLGPETDRAPPSSHPPADSVPPPSRRSASAREHGARDGAALPLQRRVDDDDPDRTPVPGFDASGDWSIGPAGREDDDDGVADPLIGLVVADRYRIVEPIGRGGMGIVYCVEHTRIGKLLAMKLLAGELSSDKEVVRRFKREALTVSKLSSPYTVQVFDYGVWQHLTYLVMELVDGHDLARPLRHGGAMPFDRLAPLMLQVCASLSEAHAKGIVHRDIKPENIMVVEDARGQPMAKVLDFGLAKLRESPELNEVTTRGAVIGTPYYMAPEQVLGEDVDQRADIYALGAVMFRALTGDYPFRAANPMGMFTKHLTEPAPSALERRPELDIPAGVGRLIRRCMAKDRDDRVDSVDRLQQHIIDELESLGMPELVIEAPDTEARREAAPAQAATRDELEAYERTLRRARFGASALLLAVLAGLAIGGVVWWREQREVFAGVELEPNDRAQEAMVLPLGEEVRGKLGARIDADEADRDFYAVTIPGGDRPTVVSIGVTALPNFRMCTLLYRVGFREPLARYCTGRRGVPLAVERLRLEPGSYFFAVTQDRDARAGQAADPVFENVSDAYRMRVSEAPPDAAGEIEPNDTPSAAQVVPAGGWVSGTLAWADDRDVICVDAQVTDPIRWSIRDDRRPGGTVLAVEPLVGGAADPLVRLHHESATAPAGEVLEADVRTPWQSRSVRAAEGRRCVRLSLTTDPWVDEPPALPSADATRYVVRAVSAPAK